jgi:hypothetical protein
MFQTGRGAANGWGQVAFIGTAVLSLVRWKARPERPPGTGRTRRRFQIEPLEGRALLSALHVQTSGPAEVAHQAATDRAKMRQLSFLVGNWDAINSYANGTTVLGTRSYHYIRGGTALAYTERWLTIPSYVAHSVLAVDPDTGLITERGSDSQGGTFEWTWVKIAPRTFRLQGTITSDGLTTPTRYTLTRQGNNSYSFIQESFSNGSYQFEDSAIRIRITGRC